MQGKMKKQARVFKPYHTGKIWDGNTLKRGLRLFAMTFAVSLMYLLIATALSFDIPVLRVVLNLLLIFAVVSMYYFSGTRDGFDDAFAGEIVHQHLQNGVEEPQKNKDRCFNKVKGVVTGACACLIPFLVALVYALLAKKAEYVLQPLPSWTSPYLTEEGIGAALSYYGQSRSPGVSDILRVIVRVMILPWVNIVGTGNASNLLTLDRLSPLIMLLPMFSYGLGYLQGPKQRAMIHGNIARSNKRRNRKNKKTVVRKQNEPKQLV